MKKIVFIKLIVCFLLILTNISFALDYGKKPYLATHLSYFEFIEAKTIFQADKIEGRQFRRLEFKRPYEEGVADKMYPDYQTMIHYYDDPFDYTKTPVIKVLTIEEEVVIVDDEWDDRTSNEYWELNPAHPYGTWTGSGWLSDITGSGVYYVALVPTGSWATGYRPTKVRITFSDTSDISFVMRDTNDNTLCDERSYLSETVIDMAFIALDIGKFWTLCDFQFTITKIEFKK